MPRVTDSLYCWNHAPEVAADRAKARKRGGYAKATPAGQARKVSLGSVEEIRAELERVYADTLLQANSPTRSRTLGYLLGFAVQVLNVGAFEERLAALEAQQSGIRRAA